MTKRRDEPERSFEDRLGDIHTDDHRVAGHGTHPIHNTIGGKHDARAVVVAHDLMPSVGHDSGMRKPHSVADIKKDKASAAFNERATSGPKLTSDPAALAGAGAIKSN